ncbi:MAG: hypothetical protein PHT02_11670 [Tissierellia bacterium]|nr:hypothetical protein [Tissierellia bacterium]
MAPRKQVKTLRDMNVYIDGNLVSRCQAASVTRVIDQQTYSEAGNDKDTDIVQIGTHVNGSITHFLVDKEVYNLLFDSNGKGKYVTLTFVTKNVSPSIKVKVIDAKFKSFPLEFALDSPTSIQAEFDALDMIF